jgi:hypothetical protein
MHRSSAQVPTFGNKSLTGSPLCPYLLYGHRGLISPPTEVSPNVKWLAVANYGSGSVATMQLGADGKIGAAVFSNRIRTIRRRQRGRGNLAHIWCY